MRAPRAGVLAISIATRAAPAPEAGQAARGEWQELELVNLIRERLALMARRELSGRYATTLELIHTGGARAGAAGSSSPSSKRPRRSSS